MGTILIAWEMGAGLGHLMQLKPLAESLVGRGHRVYAVLKDLSRARTVFASNGIHLLQAPVKTRPCAHPIPAAMTFAHILHNMGFEDDAELTSMGEAWRGLYDLVRPGLVIFDHSPTALLASRGHDIKRVVIGSGFCIPPDCSPLPNLRPWIPADSEKLRADEHRVLETANCALKSWGQEPLARLTQVYGEVDLTLLATFAELDHYQDRAAADYCGPVLTDGGKAPEWPATSGRRIYAYLKGREPLEEQLAVLARIGHPIIAVVEGSMVPPRDWFAAATVRLETEPLDIARVARECDLAILNAGHGTTAAMLLAGKPVLLLPFHLEQAMLSRAVVRRLGAGLEAGYRNVAQMREKLEAMLRTDRYAIAAEDFASRHAAFDPRAAIEQMIGRIGSLI